jgi:hypothetical protein
MTNTYNKINKISKDELTDKQRAQAEIERRRRQRAHIPEAEKCAADFIYFVVNYVRIYDATEKKWIPFILWLEQQEVAEGLIEEKQVVILKARQLGMTWLVLAYALWLMLFYPAATILLFSLRDTEAVYLLSGDRLKGMFKRLPSWLMMRRWLIDDAGNEIYEWIPRTIEIDGGHLWQLSNDSSARAFPTSAGDSYTATLAVVDEADLVPDLAALLLRVKPTIDGGGQLILLSKVNKALPESEFKTIYRAAKAGENSYKAFFLSWQARPSRTAEWYEKQKRDAEASTEGLDSLYENYPATDNEALAPKQIDKRLPYKILKPVYSDEKALDLKDLKGAPQIQGLRVFIPPRKNKKYVIGCDTAEGNPNSDASSIQVADDETGAQCAVLSGLYDPDVTATYIEILSDWYNKAPALIERNNHGHTVISNLKNSGKRYKVILINGDDKKAGWQSNKRTKVILYDDLARTITSEDCLIFDAKTFNQLASIEGSTLLAPPGLHDDEADSFALVQKGRELRPRESAPPVVAMKRDTSLLTDSPYVRSFFDEKPI